MRIAIVLALCVALAPACRRAADAPAPAASTLRPVALPDLTPVDAGVREQARELFAALAQKRAQSNTAPADLGLAFGELAMLLHAAEYYEAALPAYLNARDLMPSDGRWPYYLGHLYKNLGEPDASLASFERALELMPGDVATLVWLGRGYFEQGSPERAAPLFERALQAAPDTVAAFAGLGQIALAQKDYRRAVEVLERALAVNPAVASLHSPLATAYRALGDAAKAEAHVRQWRNTDVLVPDPLREQLDISIQSGLSYELRGVRALEARDFPKAVELFSAGAAVAPATTPLGRSLRHKLGTALALTGDVQGAKARFEEVVRLAPADARDEPAAKAHYSLGVLAASEGRVDAAVANLTSALKHNPNYFEARVALGDVRRRSGRFAQALTDYEDALRINPRAPEPRFGYAMALVQMNRYREARDWLEESMRGQPDRREFGIALARILAAAPDASVRDGRRAMEIVQQIFAAAPSPEVVETMAMAAAEIGDFTQAAAMQREVIASAQDARDWTAAARLTADLRRYEKGQPNRAPTFLDPQ